MRHLSDLTQCAFSYDFIVIRAIYAAYMLWYSVYAREAVGMLHGKSQYKTDVTGYIIIFMAPLD